MVSHAFAATIIFDVNFIPINIASLVPNTRKAIAMQEVESSKSRSVARNVGAARPKDVAI
jgi:hypothetical protein